MKYKHTLFYSSTVLRITGLVVLIIGFIQWEISGIDSTFFIGYMVQSLGEFLEITRLLSIIDDLEKEKRSS